MPAGFYDGMLKGITACLIKDKTTGTVFTLPAPAGGNFDPGIELSAVEESDCEGVTVTAKRYATKRDAKLTLQYPKITETIAMRLGKGIRAAASTDTAEATADHFLVPTNGIVAGVASGSAGFGITANATATASFQNSSNFTEALVQDTNFAAFDETSVGNAKRFAIGANGAMKFGTATRGRRVTVEIAFPTSAFYELGTDLISLSVKVMGVSIAQEKIAFIYPDVSIEPGAVDLKEPTQELSFFVNGYYNIRWYQQLYACRN